MSTDMFAIALMLARSVQRAAQLGRELALSETSTQNADECLDAAAGTGWARSDRGSSWHDLQQCVREPWQQPTLPAGW